MFIFYKKGGQNSFFPLLHRGSYAGLITGSCYDDFIAACLQTDALLHGGGHVGVAVVVWVALVAALRIAPPSTWWVGLRSRECARAWEVLGPAWGPSHGREDVNHGSADIVRGVDERNL